MKKNIVAKSYAHTKLFYWELTEKKERNAISRKEQYRNRSCFNQNLILNLVNTHEKQHTIIHTMSVAHSHPWMARQKQTPYSTRI